MYRLIFLITLAVITSTSALATSEFSSGLEVAPKTPIYVLVEKITENERALGLSDELIRNKVELSLRQNGIKVCTKTESFNEGIFLYINVGVTGNSYSVNIGFSRLVTYLVGSKSYNIFAETYVRSGQGIHAGNSRTIINSILDGVDIFSGDFLRINKNCIN